MAILALAGVGLNLALGYGGLVSFGHAAFFGLGGYAAGILAHHAFEGSAVLSWPLALGGSDLVLVLWPAAILLAAIAAFLIGAISLRTSGVYFIMITLAFAQMIFYLAISIRAYGGQDGLPLYLQQPPVGRRSRRRSAALRGVLRAAAGSAARSAPGSSARASARRCNAPARTSGGSPRSASRPIRSSLWPSCCPP